MALRGRRSVAAFRSRATVACAAVALLTGFPAFAGGKSYALLVGSNRYASENAGVRPLAYAENDVNELAAALIKLGYEQPLVLLNRGAKRRDILRELSWLAATLKPDDTFLLFFAGHGVRGLNRATYWLTYDAEIGFLDDEGIRLEHLLDYVRDIKANHKLILLDHCFSGDVVVSQMGPNRATTDGIDATVGTGSGARGADAYRVEPRGVALDEIVKGFEPRSSGLIILAAASGPAFELIERQHGAFTAAILEAATTRTVTGRADVTAGELLSWTVTRVKQLANQDARDFIAGENVGNWIVFRGVPPDGVPSTRAKRCKERLDDWQEKQNWISLQSKIDAVVILTKWVESLGDGTLLTGCEERARSAILSHCELPAPSLKADEVCAKDLDEFLLKKGCPGRPE